MKRILVAGIGNVFLGDDAFGVEVVQELLQRGLWGSAPAATPGGALNPSADDGTEAPGREVRVVDFGIRSYDLAYALTDSYDAAILVDAAPRGEAPGTVSLIEPEVCGKDGRSEQEPKDAAPAFAGHGMDPVAVVRLAESLGGFPAMLYLVACEPLDLGGEEGRLGLSEPVKAALPAAMEMIESLVGKLLSLEIKTNAGLAPA